MSGEAAGSSNIVKQPPPPAYEEPASKHQQHQQQPAIPVVTNQAVYIQSPTIPAVPANAPILQPPNNGAFYPQQAALVQDLSQSRVPSQVVCPHCREAVTTVTTAETSSCQSMACIVICLLGGGLCCCLIPFCMDDLADIAHNCPKCMKLIAVAKYSR